MFIDSHAHITKETYENIDEVIQNALKNNILKIINTGDNILSSKEIISLSKNYNDVLLCSIGIHPEYASDFKNEEIKELEKLIKTNKIYAIGEIGLDYHYGKENKNAQILLFKKQLELASKYKLPVVVHSRDATEDTLKILKQFKLKGIIHCFNGSEEIAKEYIKLGYKLGIGGVLTFKKCNLINIIENVGIKNIVFETDSPYLSPEPIRSYKNEPKNIRLIAQFLSDKTGISIKELEYITNRNIKEIFDINI